ncbi:hypothetical protein ACHAXT_006041 [Thalassiosira profunda]
MDCAFTVKLSYKGKSASLDGISHQTTAAELLAEARRALAVDDDTILRLLFKGKTVAQETVDGAPSEDANEPAFPEGTKIPKSGAKVIVMGTAATGLEKLNSQRSDPLMRGFDDEKKKSAASSVLSTYWGPKHGNQHKEYKFCRFQECTDASFGSRPGASTPHAFAARTLLKQLASDPGIVAILKSRELVVGTLGEMDPIDDRLMQKKQQEGACLLGYNTNHGMRIDIKLRTDDLSRFRPYNELASTLIHEVSHNWVGEHDVVFWTNYGQMRVEYLWTHALLMRGGVFVNGKRTAALAGVVDMILSPISGNVAQSATTPTETQLMEHICKSVIAELAKEMAQHRLPVQLVAPAVLTFSRELMAETKDVVGLGAGGQRLGTHSSRPNDDDVIAGATARERALAAAEKRARDANAKDKPS